MKAVIFDMDGVLVDSEPANMQQLADFMETFGSTPSQLFLNTLVGTSYDYTCQLCIEYMNIQMDLEEFKQKLDVYIQEHPYKYIDFLNSEAIDILKWLKQNGYKTAIASSSLIFQIKKMLSECHLEHVFDEILSGEMFKESKPNPEIYLTAAQKLNVSCEECLVIEDSYYGIEAGKRAGMKVLAVEDKRYGIDQSKADAKISHLSEIKNYV